MSLDSRQVDYRTILSQLFPHVSHKTLDILLQSIDADLTLPLRIDATSSPSLMVNVGASVVSNPESDRNRSISFIDSAVPSFSGGTVTFPSSSGGNVTTSSGGSATLTCTSGQFCAVLLLLDSSGNLVAKPGVAAASAPLALVPIPTGTDLPFGYVIVSNIGGTIQPISQNSIYQFQSSGGSNGGSSGGAANEVSLTSSTTSQVVTFGTPQSSTTYVPLCQIVNTVDGSVAYFPITITNKTTSGFTASWNTPIGTGNYKLDYLVGPGAIEQPGETILSSGVTSAVITIPIPYTSTSYVVIAQLVDYTDSSIQYQPVTVTGKTNSTFTVEWNVPTGSVNYRISWQIAAFQ